MRLLSLRLQNFRQHADTRVTFEPGLTGIIGPNGSGKSTLLEAIAWALYGNPAARGTRDSIRFTGAKDKAPVRVELQFELSDHHYRVVRGLTQAECFLDRGDSPVASTISGVTEFLQRRLGMTRAEFFHTYFTGQKELDVMSALGPADRARFLSRVLGYDRISGAQEITRERRRALIAEISGLKQGMADAAVVSRAVSTARTRVADAASRAHETDRARIDTANALAELVPRWTAAQAERERVQQLLSDLRVAEHQSTSATREIARLDGELAAIDRASTELAPLATQLAALPAMQTELAALDRLAAAESKRQTLIERVRATGDEATKLAERGAQLATAPELEKQTAIAMTSARAKLGVVESTLDTERTTWARDRQEAETRLETLTLQRKDLDAQKKTLEGLGENSPCPTCGRPLGSSYNTVLELLIEQLSTVSLDGKYYRTRAEQLAKPPESVTALEGQRKATQVEITALERRLAKIQQGVAELSELAGRRADVDRKLDAARIALAALPEGYEETRHGLLRDEVATLNELAKRAERLRTTVERGAFIRSERDRFQSALEQATERRATLETRRGDATSDDAEYQALRTAHQAAMDLARAAEHAAINAEGDLRNARTELAAAERSKQELERLQQRLSVLDLDRRLHDELDRAFGDLRTDLNFQLRPELADTASAFLRELTDARYSELEFDDEYNLQVMENGIPKPVISGGEEDLCNLVLRLAISQMIAERAGQRFSLLVLDEVFGSLDDTRRANVVELLRRLNDRFEQVIVITHIEGVREGMDRVLVVRFDETRGTSVVSHGLDDEPVAVDGDDALETSDAPELFASS